MINLQKSVEAMSSSDLLSATETLVRTSRGTEADLLVHLGEIDERKLYLPRSYRSMFAFCVGEYGFSEDVTCYRIAVARAARRLPLILEAVRSGQVHLAGLRVLVPHLTAENHRDLLSAAAGKSRGDIEELVARLAPQPPAPTVIRRIPAQPASTPDAACGSLFGSVSAAAPAQSLTDVPPATAPDVPPALAFAPRRDGRPASVSPLSEDAYKFQFTATRACREKLRQAQDLLRHRIPNGDVGTIVEKALDALIEKVKKERFADVRNPRKPAIKEDAAASSRHLPDAIKRAVFERDGGRCTFTDERGKRCEETGGLEFDHKDGFARTRVHRADRIRLLCAAHNRYAAEQMYGRDFMARARASHDAAPTLPGNLSG
jgi:hypothetical protein